MIIEKDLYCDTIEQLAEELHAPVICLQPIIETGTLYFNGFSGTWWIRYEIEDPTEEELQKEKIVN